MKQNSQPTTEAGKGLGTVLVAAPVHSVLTEGLGGLGYNCVVREDITQAMAYELISDCVGVVTSTRLQLDKELIDAAPKLRWIGRMGSGMEVIDVAYAKQKGIACFASPEGNCDAVAEHALGMLLSLLRRITWSHTEIRNGLWRREENRGMELGGKTVAIIGYGHAGSAFARKLQGFDIRILAYDKYAPENIPPYIINCENLVPVYENADIISFHVPFQPDTLHYFNEYFITKMRKPFILVNTSRGAVVDTGALLAGMANGKVAGACLDVLEKEPLSAMGVDLQRGINQQIALPNLLLTPHIAGYTFEALYKMSKALLDKISACPAE